LFWFAPRRSIHAALLFCCPCRLEREIRRERDEGEDGHNQASRKHQASGKKTKGKSKHKTSKIKQFLIT